MYALARGGRGCWVGGEGGKHREAATYSIYIIHSNLETTVV